MYPPPPPLWKNTHQNPSVLCTPPFGKTPIKIHRFCVLPPLEKHPSKSIGFVYSPLWKNTHQNPSVLCTPPFGKTPIKAHRFCVLPPLKNHPNQACDVLSFLGGVKHICFKNMPETYQTQAHNMTMTDNCSKFTLFYTRYGAKIRHSLENGKKCEFFSPNHVNFDFNWFSLTFGTFWMCFKGKTVDFLNLEEKIGSFFSDFFSNSKKLLFPFEIHWKNSFDQKSFDRKSKSKWFGRKMLPAGGFFAIDISGAWRLCFGPVLPRVPWKKISKRFEFVLWRVKLPTDPCKVTRYVTV